MSARELREVISKEATRLARLQALAELAAVGAESYNGTSPTFDGALDLRMAFEGLAELARASYMRLCALSEEPKGAPTNTRPRRRKPRLSVVTPGAA